ncbi:MAG: glycosyltransferase family 4 protein [Acidobacteriota bacterium]
MIGQLTQGGAERQTFELARGLSGGGIEPIVICLSGATEPYATGLRDCGVSVVTMRRRHSLEWRRVFELGHVLREMRPALIHSVLYAANAYAFLAAWRHGIPSVLSIRSRGDSRPALLRMIDRQVLRHARRIIINSPSLSRWAQPFYGLQEDRIRVVPNGLDLARFTGGRVAASADVKGNVVGCISLFKRGKRIPFLLEVARLLYMRSPNVRVRLVGSGPMREAVTARRREMGLDRIVDLPGATEAVEAELRGFDVFVLASDREGMPNAVLEAMAAGLPVVATRVTGTEDVVVDGVTGRLVELDDLEGFVDAVAELLDDRELARRMGEAGRMRAAEFSVEKMVSRTVSVYEEILRGRSDRRHGSVTYGPAGGASS